MFQLLSRTNCDDVDRFLQSIIGNRLGLNASIRVALRTGMFLIVKCGLVLFRLDETTLVIVYIFVYENVNQHWS